MNWYDVDDILLEGSKEQIKSLKCPDCGGEIRFRFSKGESSNFGDLRVFCDSCNKYETLHKIAGTPSCVEYFGNQYTIVQK